MYEDSLTEAARRAIEAAAILAVRNRAPEREPVHLLWALVLEESQAAEALKQVGVTRDRLRTISPLDLGEGLASSDSADQRPATPESDAFRRVIANATQAASLRGRSSQIGTDDLLAALVSVASAASRVLLQLGVTSEKLALFTARFAGQPTEPIGVDFDIRWRDATEEDRTETLRIIDAAANRAHEGLRVLEDYARFALDDAHLTRRLKECRHALREALSGLPSAALLRSRETRADVGTRITTQSETVRQSPLDVAQAACKRVQEAVRSLEEFGKLWSADAAGHLEQLRYALYTLEKRFCSRNSTAASWPDDGCICWSRNRCVRTALGRLSAGLWPEAPVLFNFVKRRCRNAGSSNWDGECVPGPARPARFTS